MIDGSLLLLGLSGPALTLEEAAMFRRLQPAGFLLCARNLVTPEQTRHLTDELRSLSNELPILAFDPKATGCIPSTDQIAAAAPSARALAATRDMGKMATAGILTGDWFRLLGINLNLGPVLDLARDAITANCERWHHDAQRVIDYAGQWNRWLRKRSVASCAKSFPAGGRARSDARHDLPTCPATIDDLLRSDVIPYTALMPELDAIMTSHVEFPHIDAQFPASLSPRIVRRFLRDQLGFDRHLVITDDLDHDAITRRYGRGPDVRLAIEAGNDLALIGHATGTAEVAARALADLPRALTAEARDRVERFRARTLEAPLAWSAQKWNATCAAMAMLAAEVPEPSDGRHD